MGDGPFVVADSGNDIFIVNFLFVIKCACRNEGTTNLKSECKFGWVIILTSLTMKKNVQK